jgi:Holliday junction resolvasome RuvABC DNA-binding subunit
VEEDEGPRAAEINHQLEALVVMGYKINQTSHAFHLLKEPKPGETKIVFRNII